MFESVRSYIELHRLLPAQGRLIVAVSGGADSLCLLHLLYRLCGEGKDYPNLRLHVAHLNHQLRAQAGEQDAMAVAAIAEDWGLPVTIGVEDVPALAQREQRSLEDAARTARYRFLRDVARGDRIAVAHHMDDQVETLILHWLRGGGINSMIGLQPRQQDIIRPLLAVTHADTLRYCVQHGLTPLEDASNRDPRFLRNRIRHELLPLLQEINPGIRATLLRTAEIMRVDAEWIEQQVDMHWPAVVMAEQDRRISLRYRLLLELPLSLQRHLIRRATAHLCAGQSPLELRHYTLIEELLSRKDGWGELTLHLPQQLHLVWRGDEVLFERVDERTAIVQATEHEATLLPIPGRVPIPGTRWMAATEVIPAPMQQNVRAALQRGDWEEVWRILFPSRYVVFIDRDTIGNTLLVRTRRPGDRIRPLGMAYEKKVQDILVDRHVTRADREQIPLFFSQAHCVWLAGICIDDRVRLTGKTQHILRLSLLPLEGDESGDSPT